MGAQNAGSTAENINRNIYATLIFYEAEFRMTCRDWNKSALYCDIPPKHSVSLKLACLISNNDNTFTVTNSLVMFTVLAKCTNYLWLN